MVQFFLVWREHKADNAHGDQLKGARMPAPDKILKLVERFHNNLEAYKQGNYNEAQVRCEFINPFFCSFLHIFVDIFQNFY